MTRVRSTTFTPARGSPGCLRTALLPPVIALHRPPLYPEKRDGGVYQRGSIDSST